MAGIMPPEALAEMQAAQESMKEQMFAPSDATVAEIIAAYQGGLISATTENASTWAEFIPFALIGLLPRTAGVMMIGMGLFKVGFLSGRSPVWLYVVFVLLGAAALAAIAYQALINWNAGFNFTHMVTYGAIPNAALSIFVSIAYASIFVLLVKAGLKLLTEPLAAVGRMAFTNYLTQSVIMTTIFWSGRGFGLFGEVDRPTLMAIVLAVWALQLIWSPLWLSRFSMGPIEWLWRRLSYGRPVSMAKAAQTAA
jgi:uncharacterized protein